MLQWISRSRPETQDEFHPACILAILAAFPSLSLSLPTVLSRPEERIYPSGFQQTKPVWSWSS